MADTSETDSPTEGPSSSTAWIDAPLAVATLTLALLAWPIAFNLGAYGEIFYDDIFRVVVASSVLCIIMLINRPYRGARLWAVAAALVAPLLWLLTSAYVIGSTSEAMDRPVFVIWFWLIVLVSLPLTLRLLDEMFMPEIQHMANRRRFLAIVAIVAGIALFGFVVGLENHRFMTCDDFLVAGSFEPDDCAIVP